MKEAFAPIGAEMANQRFLRVERLIGRQFSYESVTESILKVDGGYDCFSP